MEILLKTPVNIVYLSLRFLPLHRCYESSLYIVKYLRNIMCVYFVTDVTKLKETGIIENSSGDYG